MYFYITTDVHHKNSDCSLQNRRERELSDDDILYWMKKVHSRLGLGNLHLSCFIIWKTWGKKWTFLGMEMRTAKRSERSKNHIKVSLFEVPLKSVLNDFMSQRTSLTSRSVLSTSSFTKTCFEKIISHDFNNLEVTLNILEVSLNSLEFDWKSCLKI